MPRTSPAMPLRSLIRDGAGAVAAGCFDAFSAFLADRAGFDMLHVTGFGVEVSMLAGPDMGLVTLTELSNLIDRIATVVDKPIICDVDSGFGEIENIRRTVRTMERAGAAAVHIEDVDRPKRNPFVDGRTLFSRAEAAGRVGSACDARTDPDFVIIARSDADEVSIDELIARCNLYLAAGADMAMPILSKVNGRKIGNLSPEDQMAVHAKIVGAIEGPVFGVAVPPGCKALDMIALGYSVISLPMITFMPSASAMIRSLNDAMSSIKPHSPDLAASAKPLESPFDLMKMLGIDEFLDRQAKFIRF